MQLQNFYHKDQHPTVKKAAESLKALDDQTEAQRPTPPQ